VLNPGDEALIPAPYWVSYPDMVLLADGEPVIVATGPETGYKLTPAQLKAGLTDKTRLMFLNSPSNPTGAAYTRAELVALGEVLRDYPDVVIGTDDMYEHIYWADEPFCSLVTACPHLDDRTVTINGVSKAYAMTGWRIGYCGGPKSIIAAMRKIQSQSTSNPTSISQAASVAALNGSQACVAEMVVAFRERHDFIVAALNDIPGISCLPGAGTFYAFPDCREAIAAGGFADDTALSEFLLKKVGVAVVPGTAFGAPGHIRLSFACSLDMLRDAAKRIRDALAGSA
jgi:aspartate aminotransferase